MEDWNVYFVLECCFDYEVFWCFDVFQINVVEGWFEYGNCVDEFVDVGFVYFDVENVDVGEFFEQDCFVFYYRFGGQWFDIVEIQNGGVVGDNSYQIVMGGVVGCFGWIFGDFQIGCCDFW